LFGAAQQQEVVAMKSFDAVTKIAESPSCIVWGKNISAGMLAALALVCSITVGCSSEKPKPVSSTSQIPMTPPQTEAVNPVVSVPEVAKTAPKKVVKKRPTTVTYSDKTYGVSFEYPRKYAIETGDAANEILALIPLPVNSAQSGGVALAAVELPETGFANTDFSSAFFGVSVNKALTAEQCGEFSGAQAKPAVAGDASGQATSPSVSSTSSSTKSEVKSEQTTSVPAESSASAATSAVEPEGSKRMLGDAELHATETVTGEGARQSDAKYFRSFQNGACYEFALNVTTVAREGAGMKHVDRDKIFDRLEKILATVKINPLVAAPAPETTASIPATPAVPETPVQ